MLRLLKPLSYVPFLLLLACGRDKAVSKTTCLYLSEKNLVRLPDSVTKMENLVELHLGNSFTLFPPFSVTVGDSANHIKSLPAAIRNLTKLRILEIDANDLEYLPEQIARLPALDTLSLCFNPHLTLSKELGKFRRMKRLKYLDIAGITTDESSIAILRAELPDTKIIATVEDWVKNAQSRLDAIRNKTHYLK